MLDTRGPIEIARAACGNRCVGTSVKPLLGAGATPIFPATWTVPAWFIDPQNSATCASDGNSGTAATCTGGCVGATCPSGIGPLLTFQELNVHRWLCLGNPSMCPRIRQNTTLTFLSSHTTNADPVPLKPSLEAGANMIVQANLPTATWTSTPGVITAKNRATPALLQGATIPAGVAAGQLVVNATHASRAFVYKVGGTVTYSQPLAPTALPGPANTFPAEVDTWASTDSLTAFVPVSVDVVDLEPTVVDYNGAFNSVLYLSQITLFDPGGIGSDNLYIGQHVAAYDVVSQRAISNVAVTVDEFQTWANVFNQGGLLGGPIDGSIWASVGGVMQLPFVGVDTNAAAAFDGDIIFNVAVGSFSNGALLGLVYVETGQTVRLGSGNSLLTTIGGGYATTALWGPGALAVNNNAHFGYDNSHGGATGVLLLTGGITLNGVTGGGGSSRVLCNTLAAPTTLVNPLVTLTGAHLDAACAGATGFGGFAYVLGAGSIDNQLL